MCALALLSSISTLSKGYPPYGRILLLLPFFYLATNPSFRNPLPPFNISRFDRPREERIWEELAKRDDLAGSSHFYTNINFRHQIFCDKPRKIIWNVNYDDSAEKTGWLMHYGTRPFFLLDRGDPLVENLEMQRIELGLEREDLEGFTLFHRVTVTP